MSQGEYATVKALVKMRTERAVLLEREGDDGAGGHLLGGWVPRKAIHFSCRELVERAVYGDEIEVRIELAMAEEKKLI